MPPAELKIDSLNERFACPGSLEFVEGRGGLTMASTDRCTGEIYLHGAHVTSWQPEGHQEVLWVGESSYFEDGRPIRGGVPLCWPWFGDDPDGAGRPAHGFARNSKFAVTRTWSRRLIRDCGSTPTVGSSSNRIFGLCTMPQAKLSRR